MSYSFGVALLEEGVLFWKMKDMARHIRIFTASSANSQSQPLRTSDASDTVLRNRLNRI